jgi:fumarate hydratase subunit alpha
MALADAYKHEDNQIAQNQLKTILENINLARSKGLSICQDTGVPMFFASLGLKCKIDGNPERPIVEAVKLATERVPLRQNVINPLTKKNSGTNTGWGIPHIHWEIDPEADYLELTAVPKGFGSEMRAVQIWALTSEDIDRVAVKTVLDVVESAMGEPCPPVIIGLGIGGFADTSMYLAKRALFRSPIGKHSNEKEVAALEREILNAVNQLGLGPMGFGGKTYALAVNVEISGSHTAVVPVSVIFQCWACRYSTAKIYDNGEVVFTTHPQGAKKQ